MKKYERLEIELQQDAKRPASPDFDDPAFRCDASWPASALHVWHVDELSNAATDVAALRDTDSDGLSDAGLEMCLRALSRWQAEHPDQKVALFTDGEYRVVPLDTER